MHSIAPCLYCQRLTTQAGPAGLLSLIMHGGFHEQQPLDEVAPPQRVGIPAKMAAQDVPVPFVRLTTSRRSMANPSTSGRPTTGANGSLIAYKSLTSQATGTPDDPNTSYDNEERVIVELYKLSSTEPKVDMVEVSRKLYHTPDVTIDSPCQSPACAQNATETCYESLSWSTHTVNAWQLMAR